MNNSVQSIITLVLGNRHVVIDKFSSGPYSQKS